MTVVICSYWILLWGRMHTCKYLRLAYLSGWTILFEMQVAYDSVFYRTCMPIERDVVCAASPIQSSSFMTGIFNISNQIIFGR